MSKFILAAVFACFCILPAAAQNIDRLITNPVARHYTAEVENCNQWLIRDFNDLAEGRNAAADIKQSIRCYAAIAYEIIEKYFSADTAQPQSRFTRLTTRNPVTPLPQTWQNTRSGIEDEVLDYVSHIPPE